MFPAFRHYSHSSVTLAESGNATLKCHRQLWLLEATGDNTSTMLTQINEFHSFRAQASSSSRGACSLTHDGEDRNTQICMAKAYTPEFSNKHAQQEATENTNPQVFVPSSGVRHRHVHLERQLKEAKPILDEEDSPIDCSLPCSQKWPKKISHRLYFLLLWV